MKKRTIYVCETCGSKFYQWHGQCPNCKEWGKLKETDPTQKTEPEKEIKCYPITSISPESCVFLSSGSKIVDSFLGKGLVPGSVILVGGEPGIGKSTFLLQLMSGFCRTQRKALYISGEESIGQIKKRADRLKIKEKNLYIANTNDLDEVIYLINHMKEGDLVSIDSIQTITDSEVEGVAGSITQIKSVSSKLIEITKRKGIVTILISHVTKEGQIAGPKLIEHMVDVVLYLEGDKQHQFRMLKASKNRFGSSDNILVLSMTEKGLKIVDDPTTFFLKTRDPSSSGSALVMSVEGQWAFAIEVQALVIKVNSSIPRRTSLGFDLNRLYLILAVLEKKLNLSFYDKDVYVKVGAGLRLSDPGLDLGVAAAILSSYFDRPIPEKVIFWGEVDLNGQIRPAFKEDLRLTSAINLGYNPIVSGGIKKEATKRDQRYVFNLSDLLDLINQNQK